MIVQALRLLQFRNYRAQAVALQPGLVALTGENGQGKTNLLEAVCVLATTKSPLVDRDRELILWNEREARLGADIELDAREGDIRRLEFGWRQEGNSVAKEMRVGGVPQSQLENWLGQMQVVAFFPHDLTIITGEPGERRRFLNVELGKSRPVHFADAARYRRALQQRNALLKGLADARWRGRAPLGPAAEGLGTLAEWNKQLVGYGARVLAQRAQFLTELAPFAAEVHRNLSGRDSNFMAEYVPGIKVAPGAEDEAINWNVAFSHALEASHNDDLRRATSLVGPHRDDIVFRLDDVDLRRFGSQGQQRLAVLALKIALGRWVAQATGESPILLLDDALSELDATRRANLLRETHHFRQSVLTTTDAREVQGLASQHLTIENGSVLTSN